MRFNFLLTAVSITLLVGCDKVQDAANAQISGMTFKGCSDPSTIETLKGIFEDQYSETLAIDKETKPAIEKIRAESTLQVVAIRTESINKDVGKYDCRATMKLDIPASGMEVFNHKSYSLIPASSVTRTATGIETEISYTTQVTDDGKNVYVEIAQPFELGVHFVYAYNHLQSYYHLKESFKKKEAPEAAPQVAMSADDCFLAKAEEYRQNHGAAAPASEDEIYQWKVACNGGGD